MNPIKNTSEQGQNDIQTRTNFFMADWLPRQNYNENKDEEIKGMQININAIQLTINVPYCMTFNELKDVTSPDQHLKQLLEYLIQGWPDNRDQLL